MDRRNLFRIRTEEEMMIPRVPCDTFESDCAIRGG